MTHPSHTFFFEIWQGGKGENRHPAVPAPPLGSAPAASPPRRDCGREGTGDPRPPPHREGGSQRRKERGRAGAAAEGRGLPAPPLCCTAEAPSSRASGLRGGSGRPRPPPPGHRLPAGPLRQPGELRPPPRTPAPPPPAARPPPTGDTPPPQPGVPSLPGGCPCVPRSQPGCSPLAPAPSGDERGHPPARGGSFPSRTPGGASPRAEPAPLP